MAVNSYNLQEKGCVFYHAIAENEQQVVELAKEAGFDIEGLEIELERTDVRNELGQPYKPRIINSLVL